TVPERLTRPTHLPYPISCLMISLVAGGPGSFLVFYLGSLNIGQAWSETVSASFFSILPITQQGSVVQGVAEVVVSTLALFVDMYLTRYLRLLVLSARPRLSPLSPTAESSYRKAFGPMTTLTGIHRRMVGAKEEEEAKLSSLSKELFTVSENSGAPNQEDSSSTNVKDLIELEKFLALREEASKISEWPFESRNVERLIAILL